MAISTYSVTWRLDVKNILDNLADFAGLTPNDGVFIVGDGANWVTESGATVRASLGLGTAAVENIGTSGANVPRLNGANTWSADQVFNTGIGFGSAVAASTTDVTRHIALWGSTYGFAITGGTLNLVANGVAAIQATNAGATVNGSLSVTGSGNLGNISGLTLASGDIIYANATPALTNLAKGTDGQVLTLASGLPSWADGTSWTYATPQATTSGSTWDFTGIPSTATEIELVFEGVSLSGTDQLLVQIGDAGGFETTGYTSTSGFINTGASTAGGASSSSGFVIFINNASESIYATMRLARYDSTGVDWSSHHAGTRTTGIALNGGGLKTLSAALTQVRVTVTSTNTGDAGTVHLKYR